MTQAWGASTGPLVAAALLGCACGKQVPAQCQGKPHCLSSSFLTVRSMQQAHSQTAQYRIWAVYTPASHLPPLSVFKCSLWPVTWSMSLEIMCMNNFAQRAHYVVNDNNISCVSRAGLPVFLSVVSKANKWSGSVSCSFLEAYLIDFCFLEAFINGGALSPSFWGNTSILPPNQQLLKRFWSPWRIGLLRTKNPHIFVLT